MSLQEIVHADGRSYEVTWCPAVDLPPMDQITQVSAICFTPDGETVLQYGHSVIAKELITLAIKAKKRWE